MIKWLLTLGLGLLLSGLFSPWLRRMGFGSLPGDIRIHGKNGDYRFPLVSSLILSMLLGIFVFLV